jgi:hypothetical protein
MARRWAGACSGSEGCIGSAVVEIPVLVAIIGRERSNNFKCLEAPNDANANQRHKAAMSLRNCWKDSDSLQCHVTYSHIHVV